MLKDYERKRDFSGTREPQPGPEAEARGDLRFAVQKHAARRLHYDFRLELDGVLKSWAVPKGPSVDPQDKRLAVMVEDHPLDYETFEGVIGHGNYGAGQVIVWDAGVYSPDADGRLSFGDQEEAERRMRHDLEKGKLSFTLKGRKLKGSWTLVKTSRAPNDWLLIKHRDQHAEPGRDVLEEDRSVHSGLTIEELRSGRLPERSAGLASASAMDEVLAMGQEAAFPSRLKPMLARIADKPFSNSGWLFEPKLDGFRAMAFLRQGKVSLMTRNGTDLASRLPAVVRQLEAQSEDQMVLDGEIVALREDSLPDFGLLQQTINADRSSVDRQQVSAAVVYYPFDLLYLNGTSLKKVPLFQRKRLLKEVLVEGEHVRPVETVEGDGESFFEAVANLGLEGMVAKRRDSIYEPGARSRSWLKVKAVLEQEFVVGGYTRGSGARSTTFGALLLGYYDRGLLRYAGRVGSGFDQAMLGELRGVLSELDAEGCPFEPERELDNPDFCWVRPAMVARVKFAQWTEDGRLRAPVFTGIRSDIDAKGVSREVREPVPTEESRPQPAAESLDAECAAVLEQLSSGLDSLILELDGHRISLTNLDKPLWPAAGGRGPVTKRDMVRYYVQVGPALLRHLNNRPLTLTRYPNGVDGQSFYQKHWSDKLPDFVETVRLFSSHREGDGEYIMVNNLATVVWLAQLANIEFHPWLSRTVQATDATHLGTTFTGSKKAIDSSVLSHPDFIVFDLDPYIYSGKEKAGDEPELNRRAFSKGVDVARALKDILDQLSLSSFVKTSGKTGLHIYVPVRREYDYSVTRKTCELIGRFLMQQVPQDVTMEWTVSKRSGKIFLDHNQNTRSKNMASVYSLRPLPGAPASAPVRWDELGDLYPTDFNIDTLPQRLEKVGDLWAGILDAKHDLHRLLESAS